MLHAHGHIHPQNRRGSNTERQKYRRGFFDLTVFNPAFLDEFAENFSLLKGQRWDTLLPVLNRRTETSEPVALVLFEFMYNRDPFWGNQSREKGMATMSAFAKGVQLDLEKLRAAFAPSKGGFRFTKRIEMMIFDSGLNESAARALREAVIADIEIHSTSLGQMSIPSA